MELITLVCCIYIRLTCDGQNTAMISCFASRTINSLRSLKTFNTLLWEVVLSSKLVARASYYFVMNY